MKTTGKYIIGSLVGGLFIMIAMYLLSNIGISVSTENDILKKIHRYPAYFHRINNPLPSDILFINTSYDRELVPVSDDFGFEKGNLDITDRAKLVELLRLLNRSGNYRYILMDIRFEKGLDSSSDSLLFMLINSTENIVLPLHRAIDSADGILKSKLAYADYNVTVREGDFTKYVLVSPDGESMAYKAYSDLTGDSYSSLGGFYFSKGRLMKRSMYLNLDIEIDSEYEDDNYFKIYNLGSDILSDSEGSMQLFNDKIIFIGDLMEHDQHPTYKGNMAGVTIHANALNDLMCGRHLIGWGTLMFIWIWLSAMLYFMLRPMDIKRYMRTPSWIPKNWSDSRLWTCFKSLSVIIVACIGYGTLMTVLFLVLYIFTGQIYEVIFISVLFILLSMSLKMSIK